MTVEEFLRTATAEEIRGAIWGETKLTPVLSALDRIKLEKALGERK